MGYDFPILYIDNRSTHADTSLYIHKSSTSKTVTRKQPYYINPEFSVMLFCGRRLRRNRYNRRLSLVTRYVDKSGRRRFKGGPRMKQSQAYPLRFARAVTVIYWGAGWLNPVEPICWVNVPSVCHMI